MILAKLTYTTGVKYQKFNTREDLIHFVLTDGDHLLNYKIVEKMGD
jgi:hypothetical protein